MTWSSMRSSGKRCGAKIAAFPRRCGRRTLCRSARRSPTSTTMTTDDFQPAHCSGWAWLRSPPMFLGIEIGGTKLQLGLGEGDGHLLELWRGAVDAAACGEGIRRQITTAIPELLANAGIDRGQLRGIGVGFGGPTDDATQSVIKSHHIAGWDGFPLAAWLTDLAGLPIVICNDADVAGLAEARFGAGKGLSPIFYITVGTGIGGGLIIGGEIYRGVGKGASEIGHFVVNYRDENDGHCDGILEQFSAGWGIASRARAYLHSDHRGRRSSLQRLPHDQITTLQVGAAAKAGDEYAKWIMEVAVNSL